MMSGKKGEKTLMLDPFSRLPNTCNGPLRRSSWLSYGRFFLDKWWARQVFEQTEESDLRHGCLRLRQRVPCRLETSCDCRRLEPLSVAAVRVRQLRYAAIGQLLRG